MLAPSEKQARLIWAAVTGVAIAVIVTLIAALIWGLGHVLRILSPVLWPLAVAGVLAYLLDPVVDLMQKKGAPRGGAIAIVFVFALLIVATLLACVVPQVVVETQQLSAKIPTYTARLQQKADEWISRPPKLLQQLLLHNTRPASESAATNEMPATVETIPSTNPPPVVFVQPTVQQPMFGEETIQSTAGWLMRALPKAGTWLAQVISFVASWFGIMAGLALIPIYAFYFLLEKRGISARWQDYLPVSDSRFKEELVFVLKSINDYLIAFFRGQVLVAICDGILYAIGFLIIGLPYAVLIGVMAMFLTIIPFLGAIAICILSLLIALVSYGDWQHPLLVLAVFAVVQTLEGVVISPKIMGDRVGLHPVVIIIALMTGTTLLGGILGGILAIPLAAALRVIMVRYIWERPPPAPTLPP